MSVLLGHVSCKPFTDYNSRSVEEHDACYLLVYSLASHEVITKLDFSGANVTSIQASRSFIVVVRTFIVINLV